MSPPNDLGPFSVVYYPMISSTNLDAFFNPFHIPFFVCISNNISRAMSNDYICIYSICSYDL